MNRRKDSELHARLVADATQYVLREGIGGLSLRPLAHSMGTTARMLIHHFGSKEGLVAEVLLAIEADFARRSAASLDDAAALTATVRRLWRAATAPDMEPPLRAMFEVWGHALLHPQAHSAYLAAMAEPWIERLRARFVRAGSSATQAGTRATLIVAAFQGLQLIRLSGGSLGRSTRALDLLLQLLDSHTGR